MPARLTQEEVLRRFHEAHGDEYDYSEMHYKNKDTKICFRCPKHGLQWQLPENHVAYGCKWCGYERAAQKRLLPWEQVLAEFHEAHGDEYDYSFVNYKGTDHKVIIICKKKGHVFEQTPYEHKKGANCPYCHGFYRTTEDFIKDAKEIHGDKYDYSESVYVDASTKITIYCPTHKEYFYQTYGDHIYLGCNCPLCGKGTYKGEEKIRKYLIEHNIPYIPQKTFDDLKDSKPLHFDFYLPTYNLAIEYDGRQHFEPVDFGGGMEQAEIEFQNTVKHDKMKQEYCLANNINLLRIDYNEYDNIDNILSTRI